MRNNIILLCYEQHFCDDNANDNRSTRPAPKPLFCAEI